MSRICPPAHAGRAPQLTKDYEHRPQYTLASAAATIVAENVGRVLDNMTDVPLVDGRYRILRRIGSGAMGIVYHAEDILLQRSAALKVIEPTLAQTASAAKSLLREARALARLRHSHVVQIYAFGSHEGLWYFAMEYVDGESLETLLQKEGALPATTALDIVSKVASGLAAAHACDIIHRDVKPSNIVIERETQRPVLIDFGIARHIEGGVRSSVVTAGTPWYMAPEQVRNERDLLGQKADVYSLACTAFELLAGRPVFDGEAAYEVMAAHVSTPPPPISSLRPEYACFDDAFARALAKHPDDRHETPNAFAAALRDAAQRDGLVDDEPHAFELRQSAPARLRAVGPRVLVLAEEGGLRHAIERELSSALHIESAGPTSPIEVMDAVDALTNAFAHAPAQLVVIDDDVTSGECRRLVEHLRSREGGAATHILVMTRAIFAEGGTWTELGVRRIAKPVNPRALASALREIASELECGRP